MKMISEKLNALISAVKQNPKLRNRILWGVATCAILQTYFVRELIAAELLFGVGFTVLFVLGVIFYVVGAIGERGLDLAEAGIRAAAPLARRSYSALEDISRRPFRHPRSESAQ
jgi:hypothetical protein